MDLRSAWDSWITSPWKNCKKFLSLSASPLTALAVGLALMMCPSQSITSNATPTSVISIPCNINDLCKLCYNQEQMDSEREDAKRKTQKQADKMLELSRRRFGEAKVEDTVLLAIPDLDRGRFEFPNLTAIVVEVHDGGLYKLGCKTGILDSFYTRNQFSPTQESFLMM